MVSILPPVLTPSAAAAAIRCAGSSKSRSCRSSSLAVSRHKPSGDHLQPLTVLFAGVSKGSNAEAIGIGDNISERRRVKMDAFHTLPVQFISTEGTYLVGML